MKITSRITAKCQKLHNLLSCHHSIYGKSIHQPVSDSPLVQWGEHCLRCQHYNSHNLLDCKILPEEWQDFNALHLACLCCYQSLDVLYTSLITALSQKDMVFLPSLFFTWTSEMKRWLQSVQHCLDSTSWLWQGKAILPLYPDWQRVVKRQLWIHGREGLEQSSSVSCPQTHA